MKDITRCETSEIKNGLADDLICHTRRLHVKRPERGRAGENEDDKKNEVAETTGGSRETYSLLLFTKFYRIMKKHFRMIAGIILHPVRMIVARYRRNTYENIIRRHVIENWHWKNHERMHRMSDITRTAFTKSELYHNLDPIFN